MHLSFLLTLIGWLSGWLSWWRGGCFGLSCDLGFPLCAVVALVLASFFNVFFGEKHPWASSTSAALGLVLSNLPEPRVGILDLDLVSCFDAFNKGLEFLGFGDTRLHKVDESHMEWLTRVAVLAVDEVNAFNAGPSAVCSEELTEDLLDVGLVELVVHPGDAEGWDRHSLNHFAKLSVCFDWLRLC